MKECDNMMTLREIAESEARANRATPGPWSIGSEVGARYYIEPNIARTFSSGTSRPDAAFIAAARTDVPALCETARRAIELLQRWHDQDVSSEDYEQMIADFLAQATKETQRG